MFVYLSFVWNSKEKNRILYGQVDTARKDQSFLVKVIDKLPQQERVRSFSHICSLFTTFYLSWGVSISFFPTSLGRNLIDKSVFGLLYHCP